MPNIIVSDNEVSIGVEAGICLTSLLQDRPALKHLLKGLSFFGIDACFIELQAKVQPQLGFLDGNLKGKLFVVYANFKPAYLYNEDIPRNLCNELDCSTCENLDCTMCQGELFAQGKIGVKLLFHQIKYKFPRGNVCGKACVGGCRWQKDRGPSSRCLTNTDTVLYVPSITEATKIIFLPEGF